MEEKGRAELPIRANVLQERGNSVGFYAFPADCNFSLKCIVAKWDRHDDGCLYGWWCVVLMTDHNIYPLWSLAVRTWSGLGLCLMFGCSRQCAMVDWMRAIPFHCTTFCITISKETATILVLAVVVSSWWWATVAMTTNLQYGTFFDGVSGLIIKTYLYLRFTCNMPHTNGMSVKMVVVDEVERRRR